MPGSGPPPRSWGWHRLDPDWARRLVAGAGLDTAPVYDLGAGHGVIIAALLRAGARVVAIEGHAGRAAGLRRRFATELSDGRLRLLEIDLADLRLPSRPFRVVANPPFALTSVLLARLTGRSSRLIRADLVLQRAVVRRWTSTDLPSRRPPHHQRSFATALGVHLPRSAFRPRPPVDTSVLVITRR